MELGHSRAIQFHDSITPGKMYADNFNVVAAGGLVVNKPVLLDIFKRHTNDFAFINDDRQAKLINSKTSLLTGRLTVKDRQEMLCLFPATPRIDTIKAGNSIRPGDHNSAVKASPAKKFLHLKPKIFPARQPLLRVAVFLISPPLTFRPHLLPETSERTILSPTIT
jgi:hypothetical protein